MATEIRPELSEKNPYWIGKHRYYELKHFCLQYPIWKKAYNALLGLSSRPNDLDIFVKSGQVRSDPTARCAESRVSFAKWMELVEQAAIGTDGDLYPYILRGVTEGLSYNALKMQYAIPCCREVYYNLYRRFFWLLSRFLKKQKETAALKIKAAVSNRRVKSSAVRRLFFFLPSCGRFQIYEIIV